MHWDIIIVGAGSAGCALAAELARSGREPKVLLLEAGGQDNSPFIKFPAGQIRAIGKRALPYVSQPDPTRNSVSEGWWPGARPRRLQQHRWHDVCPRCRSRLRLRPLG
jgi:choline dehydrogenase